MIWKSGGKHCCHNSAVMVTSMLTYCSLHIDSRNDTNELNSGLERFYEVLFLPTFVPFVCLFVFFFISPALAFFQGDVIALIEGSHINTSDTCALSAVTGIPVISLSRDTRPISKCKKSVQMHPGYKTYAHASLDILNTFQWKKIALLYDGKTNLDDFRV